MPTSLDLSIQEITESVNELRSSPKSENSLHKETLYNPLCDQMLSLANAFGILSEEVQKVTKITESMAVLFDELKEKETLNGTKRAKARTKNTDPNA